jgi:hypothetical protein
MWIIGSRPIPIRPWFGDRGGRVSVALSCVHASLIARELSFRACLRLRYGVRTAIQLYILPPMVGMSAPLLFSWSVVRMSTK